VPFEARYSGIVARFVNIPDDNVGAGRGQPIGHCETDFATASGDQGDLAG
jgi:hypothetical protein